MERRDGHSDEPKITIYRPYVLLGDRTKNILTYTLIQKEFTVLSKRVRTGGGAKVGACALFPPPCVSFRLDLFANTRVQSEFSKQVSNIFAFCPLRCGVIPPQSHVSFKHTLKSK